MNKLYWIVCEDIDTTLFEGRYQGRTRTAAIKYLKARIGRGSLKDLVFTITEIPASLIREIVIEVLEDLQITGKKCGNPGRGNSLVPSATADSHIDSETILISLDKPPGTHAEPTESRDSPIVRTTRNKVGNPGLGDGFWEEVRAYWNECRSIKQSAIKFKISQNSVKTRARREGWRKKCP